MSSAAEIQKRAFIAAENGDLDLLRQLVDEDEGLIHAIDECGLTLLHAAAYASGDRADMVHMLITRGANIYALDNDGWTAYDWADFIIHYDVMLLLGSTKRSQI